MAFEQFKERVTSMVRKSKNAIEVEFKVVGEEYRANCSNGTVIIGHSSSAKMAIKFAH